MAAGVVTSRAIATFAGGLDPVTMLAGRELSAPIPAGRPVPSRTAANALDIPAARGTPVVAVDNGRVMSVAAAEGGVVVYQADSGNDVVYAYAHLGGVTEGMLAGRLVKRGDVIGYVGPSDGSVLGPRLQFAILRLPPDKQWAGATAIDPLPYFVKTRTTVATR